MKRSLMVIIAAVLSLSSWGRTVEVKFIPDTTTAINNPMTGWVLYMGRGWDENFWETQGYDRMDVGDGKVVDISDYAFTTYVRTSWSSLEPEEGKYVWKDPNSRFSRLISSLVGKGKRLAFRIVIDARDQGQNTPIYVKEAGAEGFEVKVGKRSCFSPYVDDPVFLDKYEKFVRAFAADFNDPDIIEFVDAYGLGKWGEGHAPRYKNNENKMMVFNRVIDFYTEAFNRVPLLIHYHRVLGDPNQNSYGAVSPDTEKMMEICMEKGMSFRHDAFGMTDYYEEWEKDFAKRINFIRPIVMEGGWITGAHHRYWKDSSGKYREGHSEDVRRGEYEASREAHVNMMDLRIGDETRSWFSPDCFPLVKKFIAEGGYRLYPSSIRYDNKVKAGHSMKISSTWENIGWGYCPTNIPQWNQKYKVGYALMDSNGNVVNVAVHEDSNLSKWIKGSPVSYEYEYDLTSVSKGKYTLLVALVDKTKGNKPGLGIAVTPELQEGRWVKVGEITVK